jgi:hypothetical protein
VWSLRCVACDLASQRNHRGTYSLLDHVGIAHVGYTYSGEGRCCRIVEGQLKADDTQRKYRALKRLGARCFTRYVSLSYPDLIVFVLSVFFLAMLCADL